MRVALCVRAFGVGKTTILYCREILMALGGWEILLIIRTEFVPERINIVLAIFFAEANSPSLPSATNTYF